MLRNLLIDRFKTVTHYDDRPTDVWELVAQRPKLKKADPSSRTGCEWNGGAGFIVGIATVITCQNVTLARFAEELRVGNPRGRRPVVDGSGTTDTFDLTLTYRDAPRAGAVDGLATDPAGDVSLVEALDQQLGLKLVEARRPMPVFVIDHIEETPTEN